MDRLRLLRDMLRIRRFEEACAELYSAGSIRGFLHLYIGEEAVAVGAMQAIEPDDRVLSTYREHGHALARGLGMGPVMAEMFGRSTGCSGGRGGSMHLFDLSKRFYGGYGIVGGGLPVSAGLALADKLQGRSTVTVCFFGDGAVAEGEFHETMNLAALWQLPVLFLCENNLYAMGTALERTHAQPDIHLKARGYGVPSCAVNGMDVEAVAVATEAAMEEVRNGGPYLLEARTYRFRAHSMADPDLYRTKEEIASWKERDPLLLYRDKLMNDGTLTDGGLMELEAEVAAELREAVAFAEAGPMEPVETLERHVYAEGGS